MKAKEAHNLKNQELIDAIADARQERFNLRLRHSTGELENTDRLGESRRDLARLMTVARERGIDVERELRR